MASLIATISTSCEEFVKISPPRTDLVRSTVFESDETAEAAIVNMYYQMQIISSFGSGGDASISFLCSLSSDEALNRQPSSTELQAFNNNELLAASPRILSLWSDLYKVIYKANASIEGLSASTSVTAKMGNQLKGEALFIRAFAYFYLVNLFGDVPLVLSTDYQVNQSIGRTGADQVYTQIKADLVLSKSLLTPDYSFSKDERVRPNTFAASALLARVYLYLHDWQNAESEATLVLENPSFNLSSVEDVFLKNSPEAIWQLIPLFGTPLDRGTALTSGSMAPSLIASFSSGDERKTQWITDNSASKYRSDGTVVTEYSMVLRLAEQYLIRAEARAHLGNLSGCADDINPIRVRAGLSEITFNTDDEAFNEIETQRRLELFNEWGHRWLDLKRWGKAGTTLSPVKPAWSSTDVLYPIPQAQILSDPAMLHQQNPGY